MLNWLVLSVGQFSLSVSHVVVVHFVLQLTNSTHQTLLNFSLQRHPFHPPHLLFISSSQSARSSYSSCHKRRFFLCSRCSHLLAKVQSLLSTHLSYCSISLVILFARFPSSFISASIEYRIFVFPTMGLLMSVVSTTSLYPHDHRVSYLDESALITIPANITIVILTHTPVESSENAWVRSMNGISNEPR